MPEDPNSASLGLGMQWLGVSSPEGRLNHQKNEPILTRFSDTPEWKRRRVWDPGAQRLTSGRPPTRRQLTFLRDLCEQVGVEFADPKNRGEAQAKIGELVKRRRRARRKGNLR